MRKNGVDAEDGEVLPDARGHEGTGMTMFAFRCHCEPTDPREVALSDDRLREEIQIRVPDWIASSSSSQ